MDIKVTQVGQSAPVEQVQNVQPADGSFKFMLASHVEGAELQARLQTLMEEITMQGDRLAKRRDVKDMKHYRRLVKEFMNEVVTMLFPERTFWTGGGGTGSMESSGWWMRTWTIWPRS